MPTHLRLTLSNDLDRQIDKAVAESENTKADILRKALQLYLIARDAQGHGLKCGLVDPDTGNLQIEIVGL